MERINRPCQSAKRKICFFSGDAMGKLGPVGESDMLPNNCFEQNSCPRSQGHQEGRLIQMTLRQGKGVESKGLF